MSQRFVSVSNTVALYGPSVWVKARSTNVPSTTRKPIMSEDQIIVQLNPDVPPTGSDFKLQWKPIESAPRDATEFLGYNPKYGWVGTVRFDLPDDPDPEIRNPNGEFLGSTVGCTHWMPLPDPPTGLDE